MLTQGGREEAGRTYVVFGSSEAFPANLDEATLNSLDGSDGFIIDGIDPGDRFGGTISAAGDINGDGFGDIIVGANNAGPSSADEISEAYVLLGHDGPFEPSLDLSELDSTGGFVLKGINPDDGALFVSGAGDFNDDGFDDLLLGAPFADPNGSRSGQSYVVFGGEDIGQPLTLEVGLYDTGTDSLITTIADGTEILASELVGRGITLAAIVPEESPLFGEVESVFLDLNGDITRTENAEPYALFGDSNGDFFGGFIPFGSNTLTLDLFSQNKLQGDLLETVTRDFTIIDDLSSSPDLDIGLFDADTDTLITILEEGDELLASDLAGRDVTIAAFVADDSPFFGQVESMSLDLNQGQITQIENVEPYALFGDRDQNFFGGSLPTGENHISFDLFSENGLGGDFLGTVTRSFSIVESYGY